MLLVFLCWIAPRGIVAASLASLFAVALTKQGINGGDSIKALVFLTIIMTVFCQGLTARWVASLLNLRISQVDEGRSRSVSEEVKTLENRHK